MNCSGLLFTAKCDDPGEGILQYYMLWVARADLRGGGGRGSVPPFPKWFPPFLKKIIPMKLNFIIRLS